MNRQSTWLFLREAGLGALVLWICGFGWFMAMASGLLLAGLAVLIRSALGWFGGENGRLLSNLASSFVICGSLLCAFGWTVFFVRKAAERDGLGPEMLLIYGAGLFVALFAGGFVGMMAMIFLGPVVAFPYHVIRSLFGDRDKDFRSPPRHGKVRDRKGSNEKEGRSGGSPGRTHISSGKLSGMSSSRTMTKIAH